MFDVSEKIEEALFKGEDIWPILNEEMLVNKKCLEALLSVLEHIESYEIYDAVLWRF